MNAIIENLTGMNKLSDQVIATDLFMDVKSAITNYSIALTETTSNEVRTILREQLNDAITMHETITNYMMKKGYYYAYNLKEQIKVDIQTADTALKLIDTK